MVKVSAQKQINRENLLNQGVILLMHQGYHGTGLKEILAAVKIPKGSFYNYFASKEEFCSEVIQHYLNPFIEQLAGHLQNPELDALSALQKYFAELVDELEKAGFKGGCLLGNLMGEIGDTSDTCRLSLHSAVLRYRDLLQQGVVKAQQEGSIRNDIPAEVLADILTNGWQGALLRMKIEKSSVPLKQFCQQLLGEFLKA